MLYLGYPYNNYKGIRTVKSLFILTDISESLLLSNLPLEIGAFNIFWPRY